jgi:hypothetical protein
MWRIQDLIERNENVNRLLQYFQWHVYIQNAQQYGILSFERESVHNAKPQSNTPMIYADKTRYSSVPFGCV